MDGWMIEREKKKLGTDRKIGVDCYSVAFLGFHQNNLIAGQYASDMHITKFSLC